MQAPQIQNNVDLTKFHSISKIQNVFFHSFGTQNQRQLIDICDCEILQHINIEGTEVPSHYIKVGTFVQRMDDSVLVVANFQNLITFIFQNPENQNSIYLVSVESFNPNLEHFTQTLKQSINLIEYKTDNYQKTSIKDKVNLICGGELTQEMIENVGQFGNVLRTVGNVFGSVAKSVADPANKAQAMMHNGFQIITQKYVSQQNKNRWNTVKQKASNLNEKMTQMYKPIDNAFKLIASSISQNFNNSQNTYVKSLKKFGLATAKTLNDSYKKAQQQILGGQGKQNENSSQANSNTNVIPQLHEQSTNNLQV